MSKAATRTRTGTSKQATEERQIRFAEVYMANGENGTRAHMEVFGSTNENTAATEASKLLRVPKVAAFIAKRRLELRAKFALTPERVYQEVARLAFYDPAKLVDKDGKPLAIHAIDADTRAALSALEIEVVDGRVTYRVRTHDKNSALDKALKILRLYDAPPPPPPDETGNQVQRDPHETAKWLAFLLARGVKPTRRIEHKPESE